MILLLSVTVVVVGIVVAAAWFTVGVANRSRDGALVASLRSLDEDLRAATDSIGRLEETVRQSTQTSQSSASEVATEEYVRQSRRLIEVLYRQQWQEAWHDASYVHRRAWASRVDVLLSSRRTDQLSFDFATQPTIFIQVKHSRRPFDDVQIAARRWVWSVARLDKEVTYGFVMARLEAGRVVETDNESQSLPGSHRSVLDRKTAAALYQRGTPWSRPPRGGRPKTAAGV
jgi:hypothetical protein